MLVSIASTSALLATVIGLLGGQTERDVTSGERQHREHERREGCHGRIVEEVEPTVHDPHDRDGKRIPSDERDRCRCERHADRLTWHARRWKLATRSALATIASDQQRGDADEDEARRAVRRNGVPAVEVDRQSRKQQRQRAERQTGDRADDDERPHRQSSSPASAELSSTSARWYTGTSSPTRSRP